VASLRAWCSGNPAPSHNESNPLNRRKSNNNPQAKLIATQSRLNAATINVRPCFLTHGNAVKCNDRAPAAQIPRSTNSPGPCRRYHLSNIGLNSFWSFPYQHQASTASVHSRLSSACHPARKNQPISSIAAQSETQHPRLALSISSSTSQYLCSKLVRPPRLSAALSDKRREH
jgi:hypothetical protein